MANWDVDAVGAVRVIGAAAERASGFVADVDRVDGAVGGVVNAVSESPLVIQHLVGFGEEVASPAVSAVAGHTHSAVQGGNDAVTAYVAGDVEMAAHAQDAATSAVYPAGAAGAGRGGGGR